MTDIDAYCDEPGRSTTPECFGVACYASSRETDDCNTFFDYCDLPGNANSAECAAPCTLEANRARKECQ